MRNAENVSFYSYRLDDTLYRTCRACLSVLSKREQATLDNFLDFSAYRNFLCGRVLVRHLIARRLNVSPESLELELTKHGKPFLRGQEKLLFNISHTHQEICFALADKPVGIDVEQYSNQNIEFLHNALTPEEKRTIHSCVGTEKKRCLIKIWTAKEAIAKCAGTGITKEILSVNLSAYIFTNTAIVERFTLFQVTPISKKHICTIAVVRDEL
jgi:4'-phosphopantetheinyl transferase